VEAPVKYLILVYGNSRSREIWEGFSDAQRAEGWHDRCALVEELSASGEMVVSEGLADPSLARRVSVREGRAITSDGPFVQAKEQLAGFYLVECESFDRAVEHAARFPEASLGLVEVRPVLSRSGLEL
jgi:hypothetical protein